MGGGGADRQTERHADKQTDVLQLGHRGEVTEEPKKEIPKTKKRHRRSDKCCLLVA